MEILGHSQIALTMNTYTHVLPELKRDAAHENGSATRERIRALKGEPKVTARLMRPDRKVADTFVPLLIEIIVLERRITEIKDRGVKLE